MNNPSIRHQIKNRINAGSLWQDVSPDAPETNCLQEQLSTDVVVVGAGFCGLSTALHLAKSGVNVICLESETIGWGASGRNNGQIIAGLKLDPDEVIKQIGKTAGDALLDCSSHAPDLVFSLIKKYGIKCEAVRNGWIQPARSHVALKQIESRANQWLQRNVAVEMIEAEQLQSRLGTDWYQRAWFDPRGGSINPLAYARGLASAALFEGAQIFTESPVVSFERKASNWEVKTPQGNIQSQTLIICTNAYPGDLNTALSQSIVPVRTAQIVSNPLPKNLYQSILPLGESVSDASRLLTSFRLTADNRLIMGGAYATGGVENKKLFKKLEIALNNRFPFINNLKIDYSWSANLAITSDHLPHIFRLADSCYAAVACNGRGIAMTTVTGKHLAKLVIGETQKHSVEECVLPVTEPKPFAFHGLREIGVAANVAWCDWLDRINY